MNHKTWSIALLILTLAALIFLGGLTAVIDPYFHYHGPLDSLQYPINNQRYQNDGIAKHFAFDAVITGSSITTNFLASQCDGLFGVNSVKISYDNASFTEANDIVRRALEAQKEIKLVICSLDDTWLFDQWGHTNYQNPEYLYDRNPFNDVQYLLNKEVLSDATIAVLDQTRRGLPTTSFDEYGFWGNNPNITYGKEIVLGLAPQAFEADRQKPLADTFRQDLMDHFVSHTIQLAREYPQTQFVFFAPPYSIAHWSNLERRGHLEQTIEAYTLATQLLLEEENIHLFAFCADFDTVTNLDLYMDARHYAPEINSKILQDIRSGEYRLTRDNYEALWQEIGDFYRSYDYDALYK